MQNFKVHVCLCVLTVSLVQSKTLESGSLVQSQKRLKRQIDASICKSIQCDHGVCDPNVSILATCKCYDGWAGPLCNYRCRKNCGLHGKCALFGNIENCKCNIGYSGQYCDKKIDVVNILPQQDSAVFRHIENGVYQQETENNTTFDERVCFPGFVCFNGICLKSHNNEGVLTVRCQCDKDWIGTFCHVRCNRPCLNGGRCYKMRPDEKDFCICPFNFTGSYCQDRKKTSRLFRGITV